MVYKIEFTKKARKELADIPEFDRAKVLYKLKELSMTPNFLFSNLDVKKLKDEDQKYRLRVGDYKVIFDLYDYQLLIEVIKIKHRKDVYRNEL
jgi:mRNA interferase RelE/StbE